MSRDVVIFRGLGLPKHVQNTTSHGQYHTGKILDLPFFTPCRNMKRIKIFSISEVKFHAALNPGLYNDCYLLLLGHYQHHMRKLPIIASGLC